MQLSILDQSIVRPGSDARAAFAETLELARHAERRGYARFWVSEHHDSPVIAGSSPEVLLAAYRRGDDDDPHRLGRRDNIPAVSGHQGTWIRRDALDAYSPPCSLRPATA